MASPLPRRLLAAAATSTLALGGMIVAVGSPDASMTLATDDERPCPPGYTLMDAAALMAEAQLGLGGDDDYGSATDPDDLAVPVCVITKHPETAEEILAPRRAAAISYTAPHTTVPDGLHSRAVQQAEALGGASDIPGSAGTWEPYGVGELLGDLEEFADGRSGYEHAAGRVDSFTLDEESGRVFATGSSIGVWMSEDDGRTWTSIGDTLPSPSNGAITWSSAGGGTLAVITGEMVMGGNVFTGVGAWWTNDLGATWNKATGVPDNALGFAIEADLSDPNVIYAATSQGLFRSADAGRSYTNVELPTTPECAGVEGVGNPCDTANVVTDVIVKVPGGSTNEDGGEVLAVVGHRNEKLTYPDGTTRSGGQGLYYSETGEPGTFARVDTVDTDATNVGFVSPERMGRTELGQHHGPDQDHNIVYAVVQDAELMRGGTPSLDFPEGEAGGVPLATTFNGLYVSNDFGQTWLRMADTAEIAYNAASGSTFATTFALNTPGVQAWYNLYAEPDPTRTDPVTGATTRLIFGLEEVWTGRTQSGVPMNGPGQLGPNDFIVVGRYTGLAACIGLVIELPACPAYPPQFPSTTHPDQHDLIYLPQDDGGVTILAGGDGGVYRADLAAGEDLDNAKWNASSTGMNTLLPYSVAVSEDGTVLLGIQDNGTAVIDPDLDYIYAASLGGDGTGAYVDPYDSFLLFGSTQVGGLRWSSNKARSWSSSTKPSVPCENQADEVLGCSDTFRFVTPLTGDEVNGGRVMTVGYKVWDSGFPGITWKQVYDLGASEDGPSNQGTAITTVGDAAYVGFCGVCDVYTQAPGRFRSGIATNVGDELYEAGSTDGWHTATAEGLPERFITSIAIDENDDETIYVTLGGYAGRKWAGIGTYTDPARDEYVGGSLWKSTDAGETFTNISGDLPDIRANRVIQRGDQLIIGMDVGTFISDDLDGSNWARLDGAPFHPVMDLQLRPDFPNELFAALYGRSIWRYNLADPEVMPAPDVESDTDESAPVEPTPEPLPATGGGLAAAGLAALGAAGWARRSRRPRWQR